MLRIIICTTIAALLSGCGGWSKNKCLTTNFESIGYDRGSRGQSNKGDSIYGSCLKKEISIDVNSYNKGYEQGLKAYCSDSKGYASGTAGNTAHRVCTPVSSYMKGYDRGLKTYCTVEKGTKDGYALAEKATVCLSYSTYMLGHQNGVKSYCSNEKGQEDGFSGGEMHAKCSVHKNYVAGYKSGVKNFCLPENALRLGEKGEEVPSRCTGSSFKKAYNKGRKTFVQQRVKELNTYLDYEKRNYENLRDELQDKQFSYSNLPKNGLTPEQKKRKSSLYSNIRKLTKERDQQRNKVTDMEAELAELNQEIQSL